MLSRHARARASSEERRHRRPVRVVVGMGCVGDEADVRRPGPRVDVDDEPGGTGQREVRAWNGVTAQSAAVGTAAADQELVLSHL